MANIRKLIVAALITVISGCSNDYTHFSSIKVINKESKVVLQSADKDQVETLESVFNDKTQSQEAAPNFDYLLELETPQGIQRWKYSSSGYARMYKQGDVPIYYLMEKDQFNRLANIQ